MIRLRRLAALLLALLSIQLPLSGAGVACAEPGGSRASAGAADHAGHTGHTGHTGADATHDADGDTERGTSRHCLIATSCVLVAIGAGSLDPLARVSVIVERELPSDDATPASVRQAPEPPPPRR